MQPPKQPRYEQGQLRFFTLLRSGVDVTPLLEEINRQEDVWLRDTSRQNKVQVQRDTNTIFLRAAVRRPDLSGNENQECRVTSVAAHFPNAMDFLNDVAYGMQAELSRATIVRLKPRSRVFSHVDFGSYYLIRDRYHLVVQSSTGSVLLSGDESVRMREGEMWWFNNKQYHESYNESDQWRIHLIFDLLPLSYKPLAINALLPVERSE